jgi:hypothetical protein
MGFFHLIDSLFSHGPEDIQVTDDLNGHYLLTDVKLRQQVEAFICGGAAAATIGGGSVAVYNWADRRMKEEALEAAELNKAA